jgi:protein-tyrosine sulfotransferase
MRKQVETLRNYTKNNKLLHNSYHYMRMINRVLFKRYKLYDSKASLSCDPFFIIGSGRSGNTLLRAILSQREEVAIPPESYVLGEIIRKFNIINSLEWKDICKFVISTFQSNHEYYTWELDYTPLYQKVFNLPEKDRTLSTLIDEIYVFYASDKKPEFKLWGDKTPRNTFSLYWINRVFPKSKFIHIIRDGRDVVNSYIKSGLYHDVAGASERWLSSIQEVEVFKQKVEPERYLEVRYEELVSHPSKVTKEICNFVGIKYDDYMLDFSNSVKELGDTKHEHHKNLNNPINTGSIGKWKKGLTKDQINEIEGVCKEKLRELSYIE